MAKKYSKSKSSQSGGKAGKRKRSVRKPNKSLKRLAEFRHYIGAKPQAKEPENLTRNPSDKTNRR